MEVEQQPHRPRGDIEWGERSVLRTGLAGEVGVPGEPRHEVCPAVTVPVGEADIAGWVHGVLPRADGAGRVGRRSIELAVDLAQDAKRRVVAAEQDVEAVLFGPGGVVEGAREGTLVIDCSTIAPSGKSE